MAKIVAIAASLAAILFASPTFGAIQTQTAASWVVNEQGNVVVSVDIENTGHETAYALETSMFLGRQEFIRGALGDNPPGGRIHLDFTIEKGILKPGAYTPVIQVGFEEQVGTRHRIYHPLPIVYLPWGAESQPAPIEVAMVNPVFNPKVLWKKKGEIAVALNNMGSLPLQVRLATWYPEGFSIRPEAAEAFLAPGTQKTVRLSAALTDAGQSADYDLVVDAESESRHHSLLLRGVLSVVPKPVYFRTYLIVAAVGAFLLAVRTVLQFRYR